MFQMKQQKLWREIISPGDSFWDVSIMRVLLRNSYMDSFYFLLQLYKVGNAESFSRSGAFVFQIRVLRYCIYLDISILIIHYN